MRTRTKSRNRMSSITDTGMDFSFNRVAAMVRRYWYLLRSSWPRILDLIYWPAVQMLMWGFLQLYVSQSGGLFARTAGEASDVVHKEMYTFSDRGDRSLTLRPEGTAPICRAYIEHGMHREPQPAKLYTIATMYRYAAPQRGR